MTTLEMFMDDEPVQKVVRQRMKICTKCREMLPATPEYFNRQSGGVRSVCKECTVKYDRAWGKNGGYAKRQKTRHEKSPHRNAFSSIRSRVKGKGKRKWLLGEAGTPEAEAYIEYLKTITHCTDCSKKMVWFGANTHESASFDRIDSDGDYTKENVRIVCKRCNFKKSDHPVDEWVGLLKVRVEKGIIEEVDPMLTEFLICAVNRSILLCEE